MVKFLNTSTFPPSLPIFSRSESAASLLIIIIWIIIIIIIIIIFRDNSLDHKSSIMTLDPDVCMYDIYMILGPDA